MDNLDHWDFAETFNSEQVAFLIIGIEPEKFGSKNPKIAPVLARLKRSYQETAIWYSMNYLPGMSEAQHRPPLTGIASVALLSRLRRGGDELDTWLDCDDSLFERQHFSRGACSAWLDAIGLQSRYAFKRAGMKDTLQSGTDKPLTTKERNTLLTIIGVLANAAKFDIATPSKAAEAIVSGAALSGVVLSRTGVANHLRAVPDAMATRKK